MTIYNDKSNESSKNSTELKNAWMKQYIEYNKYLIKLKENNQKTDGITFKSYCEKHK